MFFKLVSQDRLSPKYIPNYTFAATEFDLYAICCDLNDWSRVVRWPTIVTAKEITSRQKKKTHGKRENLTAKRKRLTAKEKTLQQKKRPHGIKKRLTAKYKTPRQKEKTHGKRNNLTANEISMSSRHKRERIGAGRFFLLPWGSSFYGGPCNVSRQKQNLQQDKANQRQDNRNSRQISRNSRQDNANFSRLKWESTAEVRSHGGSEMPRRM